MTTLYHTLLLLGSQEKVLPVQTTPGDCGSHGPVTQPALPAIAASMGKAVLFTGLWRNPANWPNLLITTTSLPAW